MPRPATPPRPEDWPDRLVAYLAACRAVPFAWGVHDCATFAAGWVQQLRGIDLLGDLRDAYANEAEYEALLAQRGSLGAILDVVALVHGLAECPPAFARRGDVALMEIGNMQGLGLVDAVGCTLPGPDRLRVVPRSAIVRAWAI